MKNIAIFGAGGAIGHSIAKELERRGIFFRAVGRNRERLAKDFAKADCVAADLANPEAAEWASSGVDTIFYTVGVPYGDFKQHPVLMRNAIDAAAKSKVERIVVVSSVYSYGAPQSPKVSETHSREPKARKGQWRKQQEDIAIEAHRAGRIQALVTHLPDFYGPFAELSLASEIFKGALNGKRAPWFGSVELPHEFIYAPDAGPVLVALAMNDGSYGQHWNIGGPGTITGRAFIEQAYRAAGRDPRWMQVPKLMVMGLGLFNPLMRELVEMSYLAETPVVLDDSKLERHLGPLEKTPYHNGIRETVEWMRSRLI